MFEAVPTPQCRTWRSRLLEGLSPQDAEQIQARLDELDQSAGYIAANEWLRGAAARLEITTLLGRLGSMRLCVEQETKRLTKRSGTGAALEYVRGVCSRLFYCDEWVQDLTSDKLNDWAQEKSRRFEMSAKGKLVRLHADFFEYVQKQASDARALFDEWDDPDKVEALVLRMFTPEWWKRQAKRQYRQVENIRRECGQVCENQSAYVSRWGLNRFRKQCQANRAYLESMEAVNQHGQTFTLADLSEKSVSNPVNLKAELMTRIKGCQAFAIDHGHDAYFLTVTCPSKYHAIHKESGYRNSKFYEFGRPTPRDAQEHLKGVWSAFGKACSNKGINYYGIRTVEPHHDGAPHWHMILFVHPSQAAAMLGELRKQAFKVDGQEAGAAKHRFDAKKIDPAKGGAAAYVAKYIAKNIDGTTAAGEFLGIDEESGIDSISAAERVQAWKARHGIRQFQFVGSVSITVWREIRRLKDSIPDAFIGIYSAAKASDWKQFTILMGGMGAGRNQTLKPFYEAGDLNQFGEPTKAVKGLFSVTAEYLSTRLYEWIVQRVGSGLDLKGAAEPFPGSRVNNSPPPDWRENINVIYQ